ncbi:MAG: hypothetical protein M3O55_06440 [Actinomycetota bacterium]|nr:hypothetical protein [Actinomycetota bacterium]
MTILIVCAGVILAALAVLLVLLAGLSRRALALNDRMTIARERAAALEEALANLPAGRL